MNARFVRYAALAAILAALLIAAPVSATGTTFRAQLSGGQEVPPVGTFARGQAIFRLSQDGSSLYYTLIATGIDNVVSSHIHRAPAGVNGGVVAWLYPSSSPGVPIPGRFNGVLASGVITSANLVNSLAGQSLSALVAELEAGNAYVNVHTVQNPTGEIRGQIR